MKKKITIILIIAVILISGMIVFFSGVFNQKDTRDIIYEKAKVLDVKGEEINEDTLVPGIYLGEQELVIEIISGKYKGERYNISNAMSRLYNIQAKKDTEIIVSVILENEEVTRVNVFNYNREKIILILIGIFFIALIAIGGKKGFKSIISLLFSGVLIIFFMVPMILKGADPILSAILTVSIITFVSLLLIGGWNRKTGAAVLGTIIGTVIAGMVSYAAGSVAHLSGLTMAEGEELLNLVWTTKIHIRGLMFASILIASLGAIMDVGMSIASSVFEIHKTDQQLNRRQLFNSGMNIGRDIMGTMSNTLILAFTGSSLNIIIIVIALNMQYNQILNLNLICTELIQGIAGSIGIVITVPITAFVSVMMIENYNKEKSKSNKSKKSKLKSF
ncbi:YibE/F family protein [Clostridium sp.]|uniref:YibE/F family protein n=1 Tax=Clostridium sp. TaxID=1506 RepID=UPI002605348D|nr:YibE/F family protein [Clostridium sp.]